MSLEIPGFISTGIQTFNRFLSHPVSCWGLLLESMSRRCHWWHGDMQKITSWKKTICSVPCHCCWWFRNPRNLANQLSLVVYHFIIPLFTTWFFYLPGWWWRICSIHSSLMMQQDFEGCTAVPSLARWLDLAFFASSKTAPAPCAARRRGDEHLKLCQRALKALGGEKDKHNLSKECVANLWLHEQNVSFFAGFCHTSTTLLHSIGLRFCKIS